MVTHNSSVTANSGILGGANEQFRQSDNFDDERKKQKRKEYQSLLREAKSEEELDTEPTFEVARLYLKAQAVAVAHFREFRR